MAPEIPAEYSNNCDLEDPSNNVNVCERERERQSLLDVNSAESVTISISKIPAYLF